MEERGLFVNVLRCLCVNVLTKGHNNHDNNPEEGGLFVNVLRCLCVNVLTKDTTITITTPKACLPAGRGEMIIETVPSHGARNPVGVT